MSFGLGQRESIESRMASEHFDLVIVGGGITGAGIFRDAALRGLKVALVEMEDFAFGTSSRSSKLVHGGLRYLETYQFGLVHESTTERTRLEGLAAHLVRPLPFLMPVWKGSKHGLWFMNLGLWLYDALSLFRVYRLHSRLIPGKVVQTAPPVKTEGLTGGLLYYDSVTDDTRLTFENILGGVRAGGLAISRARANGFVEKDGRIVAVKARDLLNSCDFVIRTTAVIAAAGPWSESAQEALGVQDGPRLRPTKGTHIVVPLAKAPLPTAVVMQAPQDGRAFFIIPWHGATVIGTTDTDYDGDPANVMASKEDVEYLLAAARHHFPGITAVPADIIGTWSGLRPLLRANDVSESAVSREHQIHVDQRGVVTIAGGKLTTYRLMAQQALKAVKPFLEKNLPKSTTDKIPLPYRGNLANEAAREAVVVQLSSSRDIPEDIARHLTETYGESAQILLDLGRSNPELLQRLDANWPYIGVEIAWAAREEMAITLIDAMCRRTLVFFLLGDRLEPAARKAAAIMAGELGWSRDRVEEEVAQILDSQRQHLDCARESEPPA
jgi:glycerol-3-phosphate dehydrogenase